ncbi:dihydrolipoyllysine-residue succinyltransferase component of 2-oxoglutarate dehydrogenase complex, mitochondrial-like [Orbicella faveolata]|uniref:dihydrolipoyllysine-residue succinyltransferase component of 2-oxoglutarate dehydrogenase complex, mitochondrial-like n=1 Tax=Orbicella faveolata TaxID=48498 RepID=UPI0009E5EA4E|nr:dihydrolipoyllysine-residue succinyltransferase component of 2-oxoglutarate dehydrogenase complex, mitochondrial-like [Orbicella faveolata]
MASLTYRHIGRLLHRLHFCRSYSSHFSRQFAPSGIRCSASTLQNAATKIQAAGTLRGSQRVLLGWKDEKCFHSSSRFCSEDYIIVNTPPFAESVTEGDVRWDKAQGDAVAEDEVVGEIETDKTSIPVTAPSAGIIEEFFVNDGDKVEKGQQLFKLVLTGKGPPPKEAPAASTPPTSTPPTSTPSPPEPSAPAKETPSEIPTTPPPVPEVPTQPIAEIKPGPPTPVQQPSVAMPTDSPSKGARSEHRAKMTRMRQRIAQRLKDSQNTYAMLTTFNEVDMSNISEMRKKHKDTFFKKHGVKLGFMSAFIKASAHALQSEPTVNAVIENNEILYRDYVDISVAVATPKGLVVPVIRNVEEMNYADIEKAINAMGEKARTNELAIEDMDGGTFTISNGGVFGSMMGTPIINPPQSSILGMHAIIDRPVAVNGKVEIRPMMYLALTYDHRLIDGREAVTFLRKIKASVEDPHTLLLDL